MPRGGAHFATEELVRVLSHYEIGIILQVTPLSAGSARAPKMVLVSEHGKFLLKRRPKGRDDLYRVAFAHGVQGHLAIKGFAVTTLVETRDHGNTALQLDNHIYELFRFVTGTRYDGSASATIDSGRQLAFLHHHLRDFACDSKALRSSFHDASAVRLHLKGTGSKIKPDDEEFRKVTERLTGLYNAACVRVNELGFDSWEEGIVHGDWHPGNMLFANGKLVGVLDFDSVKIAPPVTDLANGVLQFSIVGGRPNPADWPAYLDQTKLVQFLTGYSQADGLSDKQLEALPDLMIESMIAEAILPIAATGFFGNLSGADFLQMIWRKAVWIHNNRKKLAKAIR